MISNDPFPIGRYLSAIDVLIDILTYTGSDRLIRMRFRFFDSAYIAIFKIGDFSIKGTTSVMERTALKIA